MRDQLAILIFVVTLACIGTAQCIPTAQNDSEKILTVGALLPLHGDSDNHGISAQIALRIAEADINKLFSDLGRAIRVRVVVKDTHTDSNVTLNAIKELQAQGIRIFIGPEDSQSLASVREYANKSGIILVSGSSTAPSLAVRNDTTFRLLPNDPTLARLLVFMMQRDGIKVLIPLAREDLWADGMLNSTKKKFELTGGKMEEAIRYDSMTLNFSRELRLLRSRVRNAVENNGAESVAVYVSAFDEIVSILSQASGDPVLSKVHWYGNDLSAVAVSRNQMAAEFAASTRFLSPACGGKGGPKFEQIKREVFNETGREASSFAVNDYDALWLIVYAHLLAGSDDAEAFKLALPTVAERYRGEFGWMKLDPAGDLEMVPFTLAYLKKENGTLKWTTYAIL